MEPDKIIACGVGLAGAGFTIYKGLREFRLAREQRAEELRYRLRELRHKQALLARELIKELMADVHARNALRMLDWLDRSYTDANGTTHRVRRADLQTTLRTYQPGDRGFTPTDAFVRQCFESLYDHIEQLQNLIRVGIVDKEDVTPPLRYYCEIALHPTIAHDDFLKAYDYPGVLEFLKNFTTPSQPRPSIRASGAEHMAAAQ